MLTLSQGCLTAFGMTICKAGEERTVFTSRFTFIEGPFVKFRARYTRTLGDPCT